MIGNTVALAGISQYAEVNKDAIFLEKMQNVLDECETSTLFLPFGNRLVTTVNNARRAVKKTIEDSESQ